MNIQLDDIRTNITRAVRIALEEDVGTGDITAELIPADKTGSAEVITREDCVICGTAWFDEVFNQLGGLDSTVWHVQDGDQVAANTKLVTLTGKARTLLTGERTALNFLQTLSGTATKSREYAKLVEGTQIKILDTRKTIPGLRTAQKYAVAVGGCHNHRIGLWDAFLIKENHIAACGGITAAVTRAKELYPNRPVIVEVENYEEFCEAVKCPVDRVMLDEFSEEEMRIISGCNTEKALELSGNITLSNIGNYGKLAPVAMSTGGITKHLSAIDLSMRIAADKT